MTNDARQDPSVIAYFKDVRKFSVLPAAEVRRLCTLWQLKEDRAARDLVVTSNQRLVCKEAFKYLRAAPHMDFIDLIQAGNLGLLRCTNTYETTAKASFATYARWAVKDQMRLALVAAGSPVAYPDASQLFRPTTVHFTRQHNGTKSRDSIDHVMTNVAILGADTCLSPPPDPLHRYIEAESEAAIDRFIEATPNEIERDVLRHTIFPQDNEKVSITAIAERLGYSYERIRQLRNKSQQRVLEDKGLKALWVEGLA
jgi:RNA polymerase sigma factor (sigma-70 family)